MHSYLHSRLMLAMVISIFSCTLDNGIGYPTVVLLSQTLIMRPLFFDKEVAVPSNSALLTDFYSPPLRFAV